MYLFWLNTTLHFSNNRYAVYLATPCGSLGLTLLEKLLMGVLAIQILSFTFLFDLLCLASLFQEDILLQAFGGKYLMSEST